MWPALNPGYATPPDSFRSRFNECYTTRKPDINRAFFVDLAFVKNGDVYTYDNSEFFPLDDAKIPSLKPPEIGSGTTRERTVTPEWRCSGSSYPIPPISGSPCSTTPGYSCLFAAFRLVSRLP